MESSSIKADLHRRGFTINTLAIRLDPPHYGRLLDFYGGEQDLKEGLIRVLHSLSFIEDPTRIMRAVRFEQRLGFAIEPRTAELIDNALPMLSRVSGERIRHELYLISGEREPERALSRLDDLNVLSQIHPRLACMDNIWGLFGRLRQVIAEGQWGIPPQENGLPAPQLYLALLVYPLERAEVEAVARRLKIFSDDLLLLRQVSDLRGRESHLERRGLLNREIDALLHQFSSQALMVFWLCTDSERIRERLWRYETGLRRVRPVVDGAYLKGLGLRPSPLFSKLLRAVRGALLDGEIHTDEEEKALVARLLEEWGEARE